MYLEYSWSWFILLMFWPWGISSAVIIKITEPLDVIIISVISLPVRLNILQYRRQQTKKKGISTLLLKYFLIFADIQMQLFLLTEWILLAYSGKCSYYYWVWFLIGNETLIWLSDGFWCMLLITSSSVMSTTESLFTI